MSSTVRTEPSPDAARQLLDDLWEEHVRDEVVARDPEATLDTMVPDAYVNHVPVMTGGVGREALRAFYSHHFIPKMPPDAEIVPVSRTIGANQLVDELILRFTHVDPAGLPVTGVEAARKVVDARLPSNELIRRAAAGRE